MVCTDHLENCKLYIIIVVLEFFATEISVTEYIAVAIITALHALYATLSSHEKAVRPSVKRVDCDKTKERYAHF